MKNIICLLLMAAFYCTTVHGKLKTNGDVRIAGVINNSIGELRIESQDHKFSKKIIVNSNGSFSESLDVLSGVFTVIIGKNVIPLYLYKGVEVIINGDQNNFKKSYSISGKEYETSAYLIKKKYSEEEQQSLWPEVYKLNESDFKVKADELYQQALSLLGSSKNINREFKFKEERNLRYSHLLQLARYEEYHGALAKIKGFKSSETITKELVDVNYAVEDDFDFSSSYRALVGLYYVNKAIEEVKKDSTKTFDITVMKIVADIPEKSIRNQLLFTNAKSLINYTSKLEEFYKIFKDNSTDADDIAAITEIYTKINKLGNSAVSPKFYGYENYDGSKKSLDDFKGKFVYIDVWASWCAPCRAEIPFLKELEKKYSGKNIQFVSISVDKPQDVEKWKKMIENEKLGGIQLIADDSFNSKFIQEYMINGIPRFILIDTEGKIIDANAPRPSEEKLISLFNSHNI